MDFFTIILSLLFSYSILHAILAVTGAGKPKNLPPGPTPLPIIGNILLLLGGNPHRSLAALAKIYGPFMSLKFGRITTVVISSAAAAKEVLHRQDLAFSSRHIPNAAHALDQYQFSVSWIPIGDKWRTLRKILNQHIFSGNRLDANQHLRSTKVKELIAYCRKSSNSGDSVDIGRAVFRTSLNLLSNTFFSKDFANPDQDSAGEFKDMVGNIMVELGKPNLVDFFPVFDKIDPQGIRRRLKKHYVKIFKLLDELIDERLKMRKDNMNVGNGDVLDICLNIIQENPDELDRPHVKTMFLDLLGAGTDSTSSTVEWAMSELLLNPDVMTKVKMELELIIGKDKILEEADVSKLPYLWSVVKETLRLHPPIPFLIPREVNTDVEINGYTVPIGTQVLVNAWAIGHDPTLWDEPLEFKPERFLTLDRDVRGQDFELIPFGAGRRICPALPLARRTIPLMLGSLLNNFDWKLDDRNGQKGLDMTEEFGITLRKAEHLRAIPMPLTTSSKH